MTELTLHYATNRRHEGDQRWAPERYGTKFSDDGIENLRFGKVTVRAKPDKIAQAVAADVGFGTGDGEALSAYLTKRVSSGHIEAFVEKLGGGVSQSRQRGVKLGSRTLFEAFRAEMQESTDVVVFIHGFNVTWEQAVGSALALQLQLNHSPVRDPQQQVRVLLFTWPSDGMALPFVSYKSDRTEAEGSGYAFGRGFLKVRDFLMELGREAQCGQDIHLLCHSMGNYVLQNALKRMIQFTPGPALPRVFEQIFLCAPDVDDNSLEPDAPLGRLHEIGHQVTVYYNRGDLAMYVSDYTKGNPDRLGNNGAARPSLVHHKVQQVDCTPIVKGLVEHSYYLSGHVKDDIRRSIDGVEFDSGVRAHSRHPQHANVWSLR